MNDRKYQVEIVLLDSDTGKLAHTVKKTVKAANECEAIGVVVQQVKRKFCDALYDMKFPKVSIAG